MLKNSRIVQGKPRSQLLQCSLGFIFYCVLQISVSAEQASASESASINTETKSAELEPLSDYAGLPLKAMDWLADRHDGKMLLEMPAPKGCSAAELARNRLDWYVLPAEYNDDIELIVKGVMGYNLLSSTVESNSWRFKRFKGDKPVALLYHEWGAKKSDDVMDDLFGDPIPANIQASIATGAEIFSQLMNTEVYFSNARDSSIEKKEWQFDYSPRTPPLEYVRLNLVPDFQTVKLRQSPLHFTPIASGEEKKVKNPIEGLRNLSQAGGKYDRLIANDPNPLGWSGLTSGEYTEIESNEIVHILKADLVVLTKNIRPLLKINGLFREYVRSLFGIAERVAYNAPARYTNFISTVSSYGNSEPLEVGGYKSLITESRIPLPGVSAFSFKPLDLMMIEAFSDPRVPSTENAKESYPIVEKLIKERLPIYQKRLAEIFAEDQRIADEAGLERDEGCDYSIADWGDESLVSQIGQAEAERLGFVKK